MRCFSGLSLTLKRADCPDLFGRINTKGGVLLTQTVLRSARSSKQPSKIACIAASLHSTATRRCAARSDINASTETSLVQYTGDEDWDSELPRMGSSRGVAVALGKFDAMHTGHRALAAEAQKLGGHPWLLSFSGMADVLGWPERQPLVAVSDRPRVLTSWGPYCGGIVPLQRYIPFAAVRQLSPNDFVKVLALNLKVSGVVVGKGFRFGYKASGDTESLLTLGAQCGLSVSVVDLVHGDAQHGNEKVSSSSVRSALADGQMERVRNLLGRPYRLVIQPTENTNILQANRWNFQREDFKNQAPKDGKYVAHVSMMLRHGGSQSLPFPLEIEIDNSGILIHLSSAAVSEPPASVAEVLVDF